MVALNYQAYLVRKKYHTKIEEIEPQLQRCISELAKLNVVIAEARAKALATKADSDIACKDARTAEAKATSAGQQAAAATAIANQVNTAATQAMSTAERASIDAAKALQEAQTASQQARHTLTVLERERSVWQQVLKELV